MSKSKKELELILIGLGAMLFFTVILFLRSGSPALNSYLNSIRSCARFRPWACGATFRQAHILQGWKTVTKVSG